MLNPTVRLQIKSILILSYLIDGACANTQFAKATFTGIVHLSTVHSFIVLMVLGNALDQSSVVVCV